MPVVSFRCAKLLQPWKFTGLELDPNSLQILLVEKRLISRQIPGCVAQLITCLAADASLITYPGVASLIPVGSHTFVVIDHEIISRVILLPSAESFKKVCCRLQAKACARSTGYLLVKAGPGKSVAR